MDNGADARNFELMVVMFCSCAFCLARAREVGTGGLVAADGGRAVQLRAFFPGGPLVCLGVEGRS
eukprot:14962677-Alexandrium_andersonii.AAC.1